MWIRRDLWRYVYLLAVFALDFGSHRDREGVLASLGSENELVKCLECLEKSRKVLGDLENGTITGSEVEIQSAISSNGLSALSNSDVKQENGASLHNGNSKPLEVFIYFLVLLMFFILLMWKMNSQQKSKKERKKL